MINFFAPINQLGYGVHSYNLIRAFDRHVSADLAVFPVKIDFEDEYTRRWLENGRRFRRDDPGIMICQAPFLNRFCGNPMIGFPVFEWDILPEFDLNILRQLDVLLQTSQWGKRVLEGHGLRNVHVVPEGYDPEIYRAGLTLEERLKRIETQGVSFVHVGKFEVRKSSAEILRCFIRASETGRIRANLMFHVYNPFDDGWRGSVDRILTEAGFRASGAHYFQGNAQVIVPERRGKEDLARVYRMAEFGIWASKAEGWNLPLIECLACGLPCITTNNTAQADFIRAGVYPDELILASRQTEPTREGGQWWRVDEEELTGKIRAIIRDPERFLRMEGKCLESMRAFTWENAARRLGEVLGDLGIEILSRKEA